MLRIFEKLGGGQREAAGVSTGRPALLFGQGALQEDGGHLFADDKFLCLMRDMSVFRKMRCSPLKGAGKHGSCSCL